MTPKKAAIGIIFVALIGFLVFKFTRFNLLNYSFNDMYIFLQMSCSWIDGRPLMYENIWGYNDRIHNNYAMLMWGPIIYQLGAYAAFLIQTALFLLSYILLLKFLNRFQNLFNVGAFFFVLLFGSVWLWFNDHPGIGWHPELTYLPLSILFGLSLLHSNRLWIGLAALSIISVKEDGAIFAGVIHLAYLAQQYVSIKPQKPLWGLLSTKKFWTVVGVWALIFVAGMVFMSFKNRSAEPEPRLRKALEMVINGLQQGDFISQNLKLWGNLALLMLPAWLVLGWLLFKNQFRQSGKILAIYAIGLLPILISNWVQGSLYFGTPYFERVSITWPPRFVLVYSYTVVFLIVYWVTFLRNTPLFAPKWPQMALIAGLWLVQIPIVYVARPDFPMFQILKNTLKGRYDYADSPLLKPNDVAFAKRLAQAIPPRSDVYIFDFLIPVFHKHYNIWPTGNHYKPAQIAIIPTNDFQGLLAKMPMNKPYKMYQIEGYTVYVTPDYERYVKDCLKK